MSNKLSREKSRRYVVLALPRVPRPVRNISLIALLVVGSNVLTHLYWQPVLSSDVLAVNQQKVEGNLYLMDKARLHISAAADFENKVREVAVSLDIPPEWLMAVIYAESGFDPMISNQQGSGAIGLIQFMPATAQSLNVSPERLRRMEAVQQMEYVYHYLQKVRERNGEFSSLTDLYLGIIYPRARKQDYCYRLYAQPSMAYRQNSILDENKDGQVTVTDIDRRLKRLFPTAYQTLKAAT